MAAALALGLFQMFAVIIRALLVRHKTHHFLQHRVEVSTPANSFKRLLEGVQLYENGISPYTGGTFHEQPTVLLLFHYLQLNWESLVPCIFVACDLLTAWFLSKASEAYVLKQASNHKKVVEKEPKKAADLKSVLLSPNDCFGVSFLVRVSYLFNPYAIGSCVAMTSTAWSNTLLAATAWAMLTNRRCVALTSLALASYHGLYPFVLIVPVALSFAANESDRRSWWLSVATSCTMFVGLWVSLLYTAAVVWGSWDFLDATYGFLVSVPDLTPNVGLFWYFFTEMFDHFRLFFLWVFQLNLIVYLAPLAICLRHDPFVLYLELLMLISVFKSYPSVGDAALYLALLPTWRHLFRFIRHGFIVGCTLVCCTVLGPVMWYLWIYAGSANANFYFAITLVYSTAQIFLLTDILYAYLRVQIHMKHGMRPTIDGEEAKVMLE